MDHQTLATDLYLREQQLLYDQQIMYQQHLNEQRQYHQQQLHYQHYYQPNYQGYSPTVQQQYEYPQQYKPPQMQRVSAPYVEPQISQLSQHQHGQPSQIQHQPPQVQQISSPPAHAVTGQSGHSTLGSHQQETGSQDHAPVHLPQSRVPLQGQHSSMPPRGAQPASSERQHVRNHGQRPLMRPDIPSQTAQRGATLNTQGCEDSSHGPALQGHSKQGQSQKNLGAPGCSSMGPQHQQKHTSNNSIGAAQFTRQQTSNNRIQVANLTKQQTSNNSDQVAPLTRVPQGKQPAQQEKQHVGNHAQRPQMDPSTSSHTTLCVSHGPSLQGHKECKAPDISNEQQQTSNNNNPVAKFTQHQKTNKNMIQVAPQQQPSSSTIAVHLTADERQQRRDNAYAIHHAQQFKPPGDPSKYRAPRVLQPWEENGWKEKTLRVNTVRIFQHREVFLDLDCSYLGAVFQNSEVEAVEHLTNSKVAHMKFPSQAHAAAVFDKFNRKILPGYPDRILCLDWLISPPPSAKPKSTVKGNTLKRNAKSSPPSCSKRQKIDITDIFLPFEQYIALGDRKTVEPSDFRAAYVVGSVRPVDPGSSKVSVTTLGSDIIDGLFAYVKQNHRMRRTWGGKFDRPDLLVSESGCCIAVVPDEHFCSENVKLDDQRLIQLLFPFYELDGNLPPYFSDLKLLIENAPNDIETNEVSLEKYIAKIMTCPALPKAHHRINLLSDFYNTFMGLPARERDTLARSVGVANGNVEDWRDVTNKDKLLQTMYTDNWRLDKYGEEEGVPRFLNLLIHQALGLRHLTVHGLQNNLLFWRQIFEDLRELDLLISHYYPKFYPSFIEALLKLTINYPVMHTVLRNYVQR